MNTRQLKAGVIALLASSAVMMAPATYANDNGQQKSGYHQMERGGHHGNLKKMFRGLDLTDEQREQVKTIVKQTREDVKALAVSNEDRQSHKADMLALITADGFDEAQAAQLLDTKQQKRQQAGVIMLKAQNQVYQLLTPEQQEKFKANFGKKGKRKHR
ncbi:periplasmic heavy metal sensor [Shewanella sp. Scap07]|uniref:Spy/CpxP family protein refolding chaperone n=1 Tax=Shewanella sp. Scap07 TaxID=2589987 RepID=UPI0015BCD830|nr:Spy/CpxP family protein refolding chaperone [Shewanella sp. Scap07]QLE87328.1 periplasmic heavy metal sensor [Shewanella sp. Scap07]